MKVLIIGGMHGNESLGIDVVKLFQKNPVSSVNTLLANKKAIGANCRFVGQDLNRSFPGNSNSTIYEEKLASKILKKAMQYDVVLDFHNTSCPNNDCGFIGKSAKSSLSDVASLLGLKRLIVADYNCINKHAPNCLSVEISLDSKLNHPKVWYEIVKMLTRLDSFKTNNKAEKFRFVYRMTIEDKKRLELDKQNLQAFTKIDNNLANKMSVPTPAYPIFINDRFTPYNYGGILNRLD